MVCILPYMSGWRNGKRAGLKIQWEKSLEGSNPSLDTKNNNILFQHKNERRKIWK
jgi:hypothetical protein